MFLVKTQSRGQETTILQTSLSLTIVLSSSLNSNPLLVSKRTEAVQFVDLKALQILSIYQSAVTACHHFGTEDSVCTFLLHHFQPLERLCVQVLQVLWPARLHKHILLEHWGRPSFVIVF